MEEVLISGNLAAESINFSLFSLFLRADLVVKTVIIILILSSVYSWSIIAAKLIKLNITLKRYLTKYLLVKQII